MSQVLSPLRECAHTPRFTFAEDEDISNKEQNNDNDNEDENEDASDAIDNENEGEEGAHPSRISRICGNFDLSSVRYDAMGNNSTCASHSHATHSPTHGSDGDGGANKGYTGGDVCSWQRYMYLLPLDCRVSVAPPASKAIARQDTIAGRRKAMNRQVVFGSISDLTAIEQ
jgi:hypothetical protein